ncbi:hypothetical protein ACFFV7_46065 [Nonomuraea spiralis]|uniref:Uncharacterized protein n=1 Tax=Nonomuraea spiralis TaxID=46182 RepID=A0ABV5IVT2_9ACTN|nr:hypothetical protein [Nonomuraea spiralis]
MEGAPGIVRLLEEIAVLGEAGVVIVYQPYYEPFVAWAGHALTGGGGERYLRAADLSLLCGGPVAEMTVEWVVQAGAYWRSSRDTSRCHCSSPPATGMTACSSSWSWRPPPRNRGLVRGHRSMKLPAPAQPPYDTPT